MSNEWAYTIEKAIVGARYGEGKSMFDEKTEGSCAQLRLTQLAIFIFRRAIPGIIQSQVALAQTLVSGSP